MAARILHAVGVSSGFVVAGAVIVDVFWQHERGMKTGIWAQMATMGPAIGGIVSMSEAIVEEADTPYVNPKGTKKPPVSIRQQDVVRLILLAVPSCRRC